MASVGGTAGAGAGRGQAREVTDRMEMRWRNLWRPVLDVTIGAQVRITLGGPGRPRPITLAPHATVEARLRQDQA